MYDLYLKLKRNKQLKGLLLYDIIHKYVVVLRYITVKQSIAKGKEIDG